MLMTSNIKFHSFVFGIGLIFTTAFSYGLSFLSIPFQSSFFILISLIFLLTGIHFIINLTKNTKNSNNNDVNSEELLELINEKDEVIQEYERLLDEQFVNIPCNCGGDLFQGILLPNSENLTECKNCKEKYKIFISYDSILVAQPADNNTIFENLINKKLE
jgi:hypothetical protein